MGRNEKKMIATALEDVSSLNTTTESLGDRILDELNTMRENKEEKTKNEHDVEIISIN